MTLEWSFKGGSRYFLINTPTLTTFKKYRCLAVWLKSTFRSVFVKSFYSKIDTFMMRENKI